MTFDERIYTDYFYPMCCGCGEVLDANDPPRDCRKCRSVLFREFELSFGTASITKRGEVKA